MQPGISADRATLVSRWYDKGYYGHDTLSSAFTRALPLGGQLSFHSETRPGRYTLAQLHERAGRVASSLAALGVGPGDVVAVQLPNWLENVLLFHATQIIGAIILPIVPIYGAHEVGFILAEARAKVYIAPTQWRNLNYRSLIGRLPSLPDLVAVVMIGDEPAAGALAWDRFVEGAATLGANPRTPDDVCLIVYTSGTTAAPKGVKHTHNSLLAEIRPGCVDRATEPYVDLGLWPAGHIACVLSYLNLYMGNSDVTMLEIWNGEVAAQLVDQCKIRSMSGVPFFLIHMAEAARKNGYDLSSLRSFIVGGAAVTPADVERSDALGFPVLRCYGSSEHPTATFSSPAASLRKRAETDGSPSPGTVVRIVDDAGVELPIGEVGEVTLIGPEQFVGYVNPALDDDSFLPGGWFKTGDIGYLDPDGYLTICDRKKDVIIRGGENISSKEVENVLSRHPAILEAACVAAPDPLYGERVCAFLVLHEGAQISLAQVRDLFAANGLAKQKTPERIEIVPDFPRTASGKVKKNDLRERLWSESATGSARRP